MDYSLYAISIGDYIKSKGTVPVGPLVQKTTISNDENDHSLFKLYLLITTK